MEREMTWEEMKRKYPDQWLLIVDFETDKFGEIKKGVVERHSKEMEEVASPPIIDRDTAFRYTGESTFSGLRSHLHHDHPV